MKRTWATIALLFLLAGPAGQAADNMKAFPPAEEGMVRYVLQLPKQADESAFRVEIIVGKTVQVDEQNRYFFGGKIEAETIKGWGFTRYKVSRLGPMAGTRMAVDPNAPKVARFITLGGDPYIIRYSSRLPIVVYVPEGVEVRYRIWTAGTEVKAIEKG
jgi:ecotin